MTMSGPVPAMDPTPAGGESAIPAALVLLRALRAHGIEYLFCNPGTDFPAIVEAYSIVAADAAQAGSVPRAIVVPHENAAMAMAHGAWLVSRRPQAVMVHVSVGTANTINGIANASRDQAPILLLAGRTPITEAGLHGSRNRIIHWAQEMFDQAGMVREFVKWEQELKMPSETEAVVARALELMMTSPCGPAYLSLPREVISARMAPVPQQHCASHAVAAAPWPDRGALAVLADWLMLAQRPMIITSASGRQRTGFDALARLAQVYAVPVVTVGGRYVCLPASHEMHLGYTPRPLLDDADLVLVLECDVPWLPSLERPLPSCRVVHIAEDPAFGRYPTRGFPVDLAIRADSAVALDALDAQLRVRGHHDSADVSERRARMSLRRKALRQRWSLQGETGATAAHITPEWISRCVSDAVGPDAIIVNEYPLRLEQCERENSGSFFGLSPAGGLGWGLGAALGIKLIAPQRLVVATLGDGAYMFDNPTACHWVSAAQRLPILVLVFNNQMYGAVRNATASMYGDGASAANGCSLLADLSPSPAFEKIIEASGGYGERVDDPARLPAALARAIAEVAHNQRQALLNIVCRY